MEIQYKMRGELRRAQGQALRWLSAAFKLGLASSFLSVLFSCSGDSNNEENRAPRDVNFTRVACPEVAYYSDYEDPVLEVVDNNHRFLELYLGNQPYPHSETPGIDFNSRQVVFIHLGRQESEGYTVEVTRVDLEAGTATVNYEVGRPGSGCDVELRVTYPYCIVSLDADIEQITFQPTVSHSCDTYELPDDDVIQRIISESVSDYSGACPCPYSTASDGSNCGKRSAYSRSGGATPICYEDDVSSEMIERWRSNNG